MNLILRNATILILAVWLASCSKQDVGQTEDGTFVSGSSEQSTTTERGITPGSRSIVIDTFNGNIHLTGVNGESANFTFTKRARSADASGAAKLLDKISIEETGDETTFSLSMSSPEKERTAVDIVASIPFGTPIVVNSTSGTIILDGLTGQIDVSNTAGSIKYFGGSTVISLQTRNGDIDASLTSPSMLTSGKLETSNGDISISIPAESSLNVDAITSAGSIRNSNLSFASRSLSSNGAGAHFQGQVGATTSGQLVTRTYHGDISFGLLEEIPDADASAEEIQPDEIHPEEIEIFKSEPSDSTTTQAPDSVSGSAANN